MNQRRKKMNPIPKPKIDQLFKKMTEKEVLAAMADFYKKHHRLATKEEIVRHYS